MKKGILLLLLLSSVLAQAQQTLKEALFSGKLKNQPGTVIRKGDDLSTKMDTIRKTAVADAEKAKPIAPTAIDISVSGQSIKIDSVVTVPKIDDNEQNIMSADSVAIATVADAPKESNAPKSNTVLWKEHVEAVTAILKTEVLPSKKIKRETYYATVSYTIGADGQVAINDVLLSPENSFLQQQIKDRLSTDAPRLTPALSGSGAPRKTSRKYNFTLTKD